MWKNKKNSVAVVNMYCFLSTSHLSTHSNFCYHLFVFWLWIQNWMIAFNSVYVSSVHCVILNFRSCLYVKGFCLSHVNVADRKEGGGTVGLEKRILDFPSIMFCTDLDIGVLVHFLQLLLSWFSHFQGFGISWTSASEEKIWSY